MRVPSETRMPFTDPRVLFQKPACLSWSHACFSRNPHVFFGAMRVPPETRMLLRRGYVQRKTLRTKAYVIANRGVFHVTPVRRPNLVFHFDCSFMPAGIFRDDSLLLPR